MILGFFSHNPNDIGFFFAGYFINFLEGDSVGPGCPDNPVIRAFGWHGFTGLRDREVTLFF